MADVKTVAGKNGVSAGKEQKYKDELLYCENCGISFLWSTEEQKIGLHLPKPTYCKACQLLMPAMQTERGLVKWFNARKHFGFIVRRNAEEIFAPASEVKGRARLKEGDLVEFKVGENDRGAMAKEIHVLKSD